MKGHANWEYIIHTNENDEPHYEVRTLKNVWDFAVDLKPLFRTKRKQEAIELCKALNRLRELAQRNLRNLVYNNVEVKSIDTKNYTFVKDKYGCWKVESYKQDSIVKNFIEIIHRRDEEIEELKRKLHDQNFEAIKYQIIAKKLYDKLHAIPETDLYWELIREAELGHEELCGMIHDEMKKKRIK